MTSPNYELRAVLFADLAGYSRLVGRRHSEAVAFVQECFDLFRRHSEALGGELVKTTGDGVVAIFPSASAAIDYAVGVHRALREIQLDDHEKPLFRIGIHLGEIQRISEDVYGHAVNIAARLEPLSEPGGICVSHDVYVQARHTTDYVFESMGVPALKNIEDRIPVYRVLTDRQRKAGTAMERLLVQTIGGLSLSFSAHALDLPGSRKARALIGYLALVEGFEEAAERLSALLWPDKDDRHARRALNDCLRSVRRHLRALGFEVLPQTADSIRLAERPVDVDLNHLDAEIGQGLVDRAYRQKAGWHERILAGLEPTSSLFRAWLEVTRRDWRDRIVIALEQSLNRFGASEEGARKAAVTLLRMEPGHESASLVLIRHLISVGNRSAALMEYERLTDYLAQRFALRPESEISRVVEGLLAQWGVGSEAAAVGDDRPKPPRGRLRILVSPFDLLGDGVDHQLLGFRTELVANLSRFREWSVFESAGVESNGVWDYVVSGQQQGPPTDQRLRIVLREQKSQRVVWSDTAEVSVPNWRELQRKVVGRIAATLEVYVSADRLANTIADLKTDHTSYDDWLYGEQLLSRWTAESDDEAALVFERILERDPEFAPAYASLASVHNVRHVIRPGIARDAESDRHAHGLARRAVEIDPTDARNQLAVAWTASLVGAFDQATIHLDLAATLNPNNIKTLVSCAMGYAFFGSHDRSMELAARSLDVAPMLLDYQWCYLASVYFLAGDPEAALDATLRAGDSIVDNPGWRAAALARLGRREEAGAAYAQLVRDVGRVWAGMQAVSPQRIYDWFISAYPLRYPHDREFLAAALRDAMEAAPG